MQADVVRPPVIRSIEQPFAMMKPFTGSSAVAAPRRESSVISAERSPQFRESSDEPSSLVDIELHQAFASHFQQEGLASLLIRDIGAFHDFVNFERLLAKRTQDIFSIIHHD
jgi:hypothetical protein